MKGFLQQLFDYNFNCNKKLMEQLGSQKEISGQCTRLFSHILNTHHIWNQRILENPMEYELWQEHPFPNWGDLHYDNQRSSFEIISNHDNFEKRVSYKTTEGKACSNEIKDILFHIVNHSTHHRGQIMLDLRASGITPEPLDYVYYKR